MKKQIPSSTCKIKASFLPIWNRLSVQWNETLLQSVGNKKKCLMFCLLFLTPWSRTAMAIAGFKVNQSNFGQTSLSSQSRVVTSSQSVQNGRIVLREVCGKSKWKFKMAFAIRRPTPPPLMAQISRHFLPHFFSFAIESYIYETDFTLQKYHF